MIVASAMFDDNLRQLLSDTIVSRVRMTYPLYLLNDRVGDKIMVVAAPAIGYRHGFFLASAILFALSFFLANTVDPVIQRRLKSI